MSRSARSPRTPNPYNARAARVAEILRGYAREAGRPVADLSRKEIRAALQQAGAYTSEGSLSRDLAAIRKNLPDFGGPRTRWAATGESIVVIDGQTYRRRSLQQLTRRDIGRVAGVVAQRGGVAGVLRLAVDLRDLDMPAARGVLAQAQDEARRRLERRLGRSAQPFHPFSPRLCAMCGVLTYHGALCENCVSELLDYDDPEAFLRDAADLDDDDLEDALRQLRDARDEEEDVYVILR